MSYLKIAYLNHATLADATRYLVNELFGKYGIVIIDGDDKKLKREFVPIMKKDILNNSYKSKLKELLVVCPKTIKHKHLFVILISFKLSEGKRELITD